MVGCHTGRFTERQRKAKRREKRESTKETRERREREERKRRGERTRELWREREREGWGGVEEGRRQ